MSFPVPAGMTYTVMEENEQTEKRRVVAIVGRPNVGKSAIFNRLAGARIAIVHHESGVTRDRLMREITWEDKRFDLIDTGGVANPGGTKIDNEIDQNIRCQVDEALSDAAVAMLVVDIEAGIHPMDVEVAEILRGSGCNVVVVANKADTPDKDEGVPDFMNLGFPVFPVSALHNRGFYDVMDSVTKFLPPGENKTEANPLRVAVVGRPNVGKSSYINRLLRNDRVIVADMPGTTRDSIDVPFTVGVGEQARHYVLMDTAGLRRGGKIDSSVEKFSSFRAEESIERADVVVLVLDAVQGPTTQDKKIASLILRHEKGCIVLVNKWDLSDTTQRQYGPRVEHEMPFMGHCPVVFTSTKSGYNIRKTVEAIDYVAAQVSATIPTGILNRTIIEAYNRSNPPAVKGSRLKIYYATQIGVSPIRIALFVNNPKLANANYKRYMAKRIRARFGLEGAPVILIFRARKKMEFTKS